MNDRARSIGAHAFHVMITIGIFVSGTAVALAVLNAPPACEYPNVLPDWTLFAIGIVAFVLGHVIGVLLPDRPPRSTAASVLAGRWAMVSVFLGATLIWIFEGIGTAQLATGSGARLEPITYYTRCAIDLDGVPTQLWFTRIAIFGIFLIAGHWFWDDALLARKPKA